MNIRILYKLALVVAPLAILTSCDLTEEIPGEITSDIVNSDPGLLPNMVAPPLGQLRNFWQRERIWGFQEATSDECFFPTRGTDWFDGGVWQSDYNLEWTPTHRDVVQTWNALNGAISSANTALFNIGKVKAGEDVKFAQYRSQATFLRTYYEYLLFDLYRTYPARDPFDLDFIKAPAIYSGVEGFNRLVTLAKDFVPNMSPRDKALYGEPSKDAGLMLLAKLYLNKEVYTGVAGYDSALIYIDQLLALKHYNLATDYFSLFSVDNDKNYNTAGDEAIFVAAYSDDQNYGVDDQVQWVKTAFHYNQNFGTFTNWNGCAAPEGYLMDTWIAGSDTATDVRWKNNSIKPAMGINLGFNYGQQYDYKTGAALKDRTGNPLNFTFKCPLLAAAEYEGVRVLKYPPREKPVNTARCPNDFVIWRYADLLLMKAECLARTTGDVAASLAIVNDIRTVRKAPVVAAATKADVLNKIYIERGLELYWEGHRRQDMIRFGTFLLAKTEKDFVSPAKAIVLPIPQTAIDGTPDGSLKQNTGY